MFKSLPRAILISGLIVGTADIICALLSSYIQRGTMPESVLRYIASGVFDKKAFAPANSSMIIWGLLFHYLIAMGFTILFYLIYPHIKLLRANRVITGIIYGLVIWATMFYIVLPMSKTPGVQKFQLKNFAIAASILIIAIGIPLSFLANKFYSSRSKI